MQTHEPEKALADIARIMRQKPLFLDTETTGLDDTAQVCEISIIDSDGNILLDTLVRPSVSMPSAAQAVHGITDADLENAPDWSTIHQRFTEIVKDRPVVIYNADYDVRLIRQTAQARGLAVEPIKAFCLMEAYAGYHGEWDSYREQWKWQRLTNAVAQCALTVDGLTAHRALADCRMTLKLAKHLADLAPQETKTENVRPKLRGRRCQCPSCGLLFNSSAAFDMHRVGRYGSAERRCLSVDEMAGIGMIKNAADFWVTAAYDGSIQRGDNSDEPDDEGSDDGE